MSPLEKRLEQVEMKLAQLQRELLRKPSREAAPLTPRRGWWLCVNTTSLSPGGSCTVEIWVRQVSGTAAWVPSGKTIEGVLDWFMNSTDAAIEVGTKMKVEHYDNCWVVTAANCEPSDDEDVIASLE